MTNLAFAIKAVDVSDLTSKYAFQCTKRSGYERVIIKGYFEAWGRNPGGSIDRNFLQNYKNAQAAGYTYIDVLYIHSLLKSLGPPGKLKKNQNFFIN